MVKKETICIVILLGVFLNFSFAGTDLFGFNYAGNDFSGAIECGFSSALDVSISGKVKYLNLFFPVKARIGVTDKYDDYHRMTFGAGIGVDFYLLGFAILFGDMIGVDFYLSFDNPKYKVETYFHLITEYGSHSNVNYGGWRGEYRESYMEFILELRGSYKINKNLFISGSAAAEWGWTSCWDEWGGKHWKPGTTELGNERKDKWFLAPVTASIGFQF